MSSQRVTDDRGRPRRHRGSPFGFGGPGGFPFGGPRGPLGRPRARRGDVRVAILCALSEQPRNGYQIMGELEERSGGAWRPSSGSVYPALEQLVDEGLVRLDTAETGRAYALTDAGRAHVSAIHEELEARRQAMSDCWDGGAANEMHDAVRQLLIAASQMVQAGTEAQIEAARRVLIETRSALYRILAGELPESSGGGGS